jgi:hypothetical protein
MLERNFIGPIPMTPLEAKLIDALLATAKLREEGERLIAADVEPGSDRSDRRFRAGPRYRRRRAYLKAFRRLRRT